MKTVTTTLLILLLSMCYQSVNAQRMAINETTPSTNIMIQTVETIQSELQRCNTEKCEIILRNAGLRKNHLARAIQAFEAQPSDMGLTYLSETKHIVESDIDRLSSMRRDSRMNLVLRYEQNLFNQIEEFQKKLSSERIEE